MDYRLIWMFSNNGVSLVNSKLYVPNENCYLGLRYYVGPQNPIVQMCAVDKKWISDQLIFLVNL